MAKSKGVTVAKAIGELGVVKLLEFTGRVAELHAQVTTQEDATFANTVGRLADGTRDLLMELFGGPASSKRAPRKSRVATPVESREPLHRIARTFASDGFGNIKPAGMGTIDLSINEDIRE